MVIAPGTAIYGIIGSKQLKMPSFSELYYKINANLKESNVVPDWLVYAELDYVKNQHLEYELLGKVFPPK